MSLKISKTNTPPYDYISESTNVNPIQSTVTLDNTGGIKGSSVVAAHLVATTFNYTTITVTPVTEDIGIDWKVSLDNTIWANSVNPANMDALLGDQIIPIWFAAVVNNDGSVVTGNYISCKVRITATENP